LDLLPLVVSPPLPGPLWAEVSAVLGADEELPAGGLTALVVVFNTETEELIA
jgi:hypothetical protein